MTNLSISGQIPVEVNEQDQSAGKSTGSFHARAVEWLKGNIEVILDVVLTLNTIVVVGALIAAAIAAFIAALPALVSIAAALSEVIVVGGVVMVGIGAVIATIAFSILSSMP